MDVAAATLLGEHVADKNSRVVDIRKECHNKILMLYFSASWCGPCQNFTPVLRRFYEKYSRTKNFEVIFISFDDNLERALEYYAKMPFWRIRFRNKKLQKFVADKFNVTSIPALVLIDANTEKILTRNGYQELCQDPEGIHFPWNKSTHAPSILMNKAMCCTSGQCHLPLKAKHTSATSSYRS